MEKCLLIQANFSEAIFGSVMNLDVTYHQLKTLENGIAIRCCKPNH